MQRQTAARFMGEPFPQLNNSFFSNFFSVTAWWLKLLFWFLPLRLLVVPGDMPVHDFHHSNPRGDWTNALYARPKWISEKNPIHSETWGMFAAMNHALRPLSEMKNEQQLTSNRKKSNDLLNPIFSTQ